MKRQTQVAGVRRWFGDDMLELQSEPLKALDALVGAYNKPFVISGCVRQDDGSVSTGFVVLGIKGEELKIMPFEGYPRAGRFYILASKSNVNSVYADGVSRLSAYEYKAIGVQTLPPYSPEEMPPYIEVSPPGNAVRLTDVMQDTKHRFVTDIEKTRWDTAKQQAIDSAKLYTDTRESATREFIGQVETGLHNITSSLESTKATKEEVALKANKTETFIDLPQTGSQIPTNYYRQLSTWYSSTASSSTRGKYLNLGDAQRDYQLRFVADRGRGPELHYRAGTNNSSIGEVEILHTGNTLKVVRAGRVYSSLNDYEEYIGAKMSLSLISGGNYKLTHNLNAENYMVNITPLGTTNRSFAVKKSASIIEVKFDTATDFEVQILQYG